LVELVALSVPGAPRTVLELTAGGGDGTIAGLGDAITGFGSIAFDGGVAWFVGGYAAGPATGDFNPNESCLDTGDRANFSDRVEATRLFAEFSGCVGASKAERAWCRGGTPLARWRNGKARSCSLATFTIWFTWLIMPLAASVHRRISSRMAIVERRVAGGKTCRGL
jgi:hypothetical protein